MGGGVGPLQNFPLQGIGPVVLPPPFDWVNAKLCPPACTMKGVPVPFVLTPTVVVFLKKPERVASLLLLYFVALLVHALIERELRRGMHGEGVKGLPLYPEGRPTSRPTAELALAAFLGWRRHRLLDAAGTLLKTFHDPLPPVASTVLRLLGVDPAPYQTPN